VGFRPFICRLAAKHGLKGVVDNRSDGVSVIIQGDLKTIDRFSNDILENAPPASQIKSIEVNPKIVEGYGQFSIAGSKIIDNQITEVSPDIAVCPDCLSDLSYDPERIDYPFINCTNCGPRFSIIEGLPYDRPKTTMKDFIMCEKCTSEYHDILNRRFHAQPIACNSCGPEYLFYDGRKKITGSEQIIQEIATRIASGETVAVKGVGGYHLMCDALNNQAVISLRNRKMRDAKPFAVMFSDISVLRKYCFIDENEEKELQSWRRPVIILRQKEPLAEAVGNGLKTTGAMLPYMPFHYLMFRKLRTPVVVLTSGNISEEPIIIDDSVAGKELMKVANSLISYNRKIHNRADDSVIRFINNKVSLIRRSRGFVPRPVDLAFNVDGILALGAEQKNSFCIGKNHQAIMSQYIGDLKNLPAYDFYRESINRFAALFRFNPQYLVCDLHPDYYSTIYASVLEKEMKVPLLKVQHHHAHIVSCMAEHDIDERVIGISMDGTGYGTDGNIWGGEFLIADCERFERFTHFDYIPMPGGDKVVDEPWRMAYSYLFKYFGDSLDYKSMPVFKTVDKLKMELIREMIINRINSPLTSSAGRLFDAVAALTGLCTDSTFDSEPPVRLESAIECETDLYYPFTSDGTVIFADTLKAVMTDLYNCDISLISAKFHNTLAQVILRISEVIRKETSISKVILSGGVFQNKYLTEKSMDYLMDKGFEVFINSQIPSNDGGISLGQLVIASKTLA
jgi:hydrogenase maturation protein HypF